VSVDPDPDPGRKSEQQKKKVKKNFTLFSAVYSPWKAGGSSWSWKVHRGCLRINILKFLIKNI
jgi:hypothetical protein